MEFDRTLMLPETCTTVSSTPLRTLAWKQAIAAHNDKYPACAPIQWRVNERDYFDYLYLVNVEQIPADRLLELGWEASVAYRELKAQQG